MEFSDYSCLEKISTALSAGCSVIVKPDVITPGSVMELVDICREAGVPPGVVNLLSGDPPFISDQLLSSNIIKKFQLLVQQKWKNYFKKSCRKSSKSYNGVKRTFTFYCF